MVGGKWVINAAAASSGESCGIISRLDWKKFSYEVIYTSCIKIYSS